MEGPNGAPRQRSGHEFPIRAGGGGAPRPPPPSPPRWGAAINKGDGQGREREAEPTL